MAEEKIIIPSSAEGDRLSQWLAVNGYGVSADCGGRGVCGKCAVTPIRGEFLSADGSPLIPDKNGTILSCRAYCPRGGGEIIVHNTRGGGVSGYSGKSSIREDIGKVGFGIALDIGTTTLAAALVSLSDGSVLGTYSCLNPQRSFGADVISRIGACSVGGLPALHALIISKTNEIIAYFADKFPDSRPKILTVAGNTTMLHLFLGVSPCGMGAYPFTPAFTEAKKIAGETLGLNVGEVLLLPSASAFIGADVVCGACAVGLTELDFPSVILDIGTNGEMLLCTGKSSGARLYAAATSAGPAFEGANISCGVGGVPGAVSRVCLRGDGSVICETIEGTPAVGICGCGLVDLISVLLKTGELDETGRLEHGDYALTNGTDGAITLTGKDVREFQLAKSAVRAGLEALCDGGGVDLSDIGRVYIAGGLGYYMNIENAAEVGILPRELTGRAEAFGNSALKGAELALLSDDFLADAKRLAVDCEVLELNRSEVFNDKFIKYMVFGEE